MVPRETPPKPLEWIKGVNIVVRSETTPKLAENKIEVPVIRPEPTISLHVGMYHRRSQALRVQRRITSKLKLPVEIIQQYEYYHVMVTGFYTRQETYKYYPELAGLGYPRISLIEKK
jgi:hypothetical protein